MRIKHNKKRNTAFVYEALIVEATLAIIKKDLDRQNKTFDIIRKHFKPTSVLRKDLDCYRSLYENQNLKEATSKRILKEARLQKKIMGPDSIFKAQTSLIHDINKTIGSSTFDNFVPNYKTLASIAQLFSDNISPKNQIILENQIISKMAHRKEEGTTEAFDKTIYTLFANKFNSKYNSQLLPEQKELLTYYISSFTDNAVTLKVFLNEELTRLKKLLTEAASVEEIKSDNTMVTKTNTIVEKLNGFSKQEISDDMLLTVLKTQSLVKEIYTDGNSN